MCRLLAVKSSVPFEISHYLQPFASISENCEVYQGHGWGCSFLSDGKWTQYKNIDPIWEDDVTRFGITTLLLAHSRNAFRDEDIGIENNMPFYDETNSFIFNGELHGVKLKETGRTGAEKIFNFIKRFDKGDTLEAVKKGISIINKRTRYVKAMNLVLSDGNRFYAASQFSENPGYYTLHCTESETTAILCSAPFPPPWKSASNRFRGESWIPLENNSIREF